ncbi:hypothetical protein [Streptomyces subrutilus]|uniref:hypothetical protein n=1 Tax=Streptomyces subrutilus TaxID=36818 RepID=UPI0033F6E267
MSAPPSDDDAQPVVLDEVFIGHEGGEGSVVLDGVPEQELCQCGRGCLCLRLGFGVVDVDACGLEFFDGGVADDGLLLLGEEASVEVAEDEGIRRALEICVEQQGHDVRARGDCGHGGAPQVGWIGTCIDGLENPRFG